MMIAGSVYIQPARFTPYGPTMARPTSRTRTGSLTRTTPGRSDGGRAGEDAVGSLRRLNEGTAAVGEDIVVKPLGRRQPVVGLQRESLSVAIQCL
jgi:hypothetical protein